MLGLDLSPIITKMYDVWVSKIDEKDSRIAIRYRLKRERNYNLSLFSLLRGKKNISNEILVKSFKINAIEELISLPLPMDKILDKKIDFGDKDTKNKNHKDWSKGINHEALLLERIWLRIQVARIRVLNDAGTGDINYIKFLLQKMNSSLSVTN